jgi:hypothetical protein
MPATSFTCPKCHSTLRSATPIPDGRKIKCPKCSTIFVTAADKPKAPATGIQEKARMPAPPVRREEPAVKEEVLGDEGWELVDDDPAGAKNGRIEAIPFATDDADLPVAAVDDEDDEEVVRPRSKGASAKPKAKAKPRRDEDDEDDEPPPRPKKSPAKARRHEEDEDDEDDEPPPARKSARKAVVHDDYDEDEDEDDEDRYDDEDEDDLPRQKSRRKGKAARSGGLMKVYLAVLAGVLVLFLVGGGLAAYWILNRDVNRGIGEDDLLVYVPPDSLFVAGLDLGALRSHPQVASWLQEGTKDSGTDRFLQEVKKNTGLEEADLFDRVIVVLQSNPAMHQPGSDAGRMIIAKSKVPFNQKKIRDSAKNATAQRYQGKTYFKTEDGTNTTMYMPSDRVLILTNMSETHIQQIITNNGAKPLLDADMVAMIRTMEASPFWMSMSMGAATKQSFPMGFPFGGPGGPGGPGDGMVPPELKTLGDHLNKAKSLGLWGSLDATQVNVHLGIRFADGTAAKEVASLGQSIWDKQVKPLAALAGFAGGANAKLLKEVTDSARFSSQGDMAKASITMSLQVLEASIKESQANQGNRGPAPRGGGPPGGGARGGNPPGGGRGGIPPGGMRPGLPGGRKGR